MTPRFIRSLGVSLLAAPCLAIVLLAAGCGGGSDNSGTVVTAPPPVTAPVPQTTAIAQCIVDSDPDVVIGDSSTDANSGCDSVVMDVAKTQTDFDEILVGHGGTLAIINSGGEGSSATGTAPRDGTELVSHTYHEICIKDGGTVSAGTPDKPITSRNKVVITFEGTRNSKPNDYCTDDFRKGIEVRKGGSLLLYGTKGVPARGGVSWTTLAAPAGSNVPGAKAASTGLETLHLTADVTKGAEGWAVGDWIVVGTTDFVPFHSEFVQIASVTSNASKDCAGSAQGCSAVTLAQPLKYYHFGSLAPSPATASCADPLASVAPPLKPTAPATQPGFLCDGEDRNYGVDERAEVGLISRDIELTAITPPPPASATAMNLPPPPATSSVHWGGEIMIHQGFTQVAVQGVRLSKFGKDQLGSYPIHFHMAGDVANKPLIDSDSVDHSYNHCVTIHDTSNLTVSNFVCARIVGHIYYEELGDANANNVADDSGIVFKHDLGLGAMSNSFDIYGLNVVASPPPAPSPGSIPPGTYSRAYMIAHYWWTGDYMTNADCKSGDTCIGYDGFNIPDTDNQLQTTHGGCFTTTAMGSWQSAGIATPCSNGQYYVEPASGFWILNPDTTLVDNAIGGCQGLGAGFWWVPPENPIKVNDEQLNLQFQPLGTVRGDRAHACYNGFFDDNSIAFITSGQLFPQASATLAGNEPSIIATFDGLTATRNRLRGVWLRPTWIVVKNARFATNRENVTLLSSGGIDGNAPGVWNLLADSVLVGLSRNNVNRWGPCPYSIFLTGFAPIGGIYGCIDYIPAMSPHSGEIFDQGYQAPFWNSEGYMLYDGPVRLFHDRFVNFNADDPVPDYSDPSTDCSTRPQAGCQFSNQLDDADLAFLIYYSKNSPPPVNPPPHTEKFVYEGDAALGWFQSNQNSYPSGTVSKQLSFVNTNLRHEVYTSRVSVNTNFNDGDKNTSIIDEDGTLSGIGVQLAPGAGSNPVHPISLNNLPFNNTSNAVDECLSRGAQNQQYEGRTSALMSPATVGTLQFSSLYPNDGSFPGDANSHWQQVTFTRDDMVSKTPSPSTARFHPTMVMRTGRNGLGSFEPKVSNGYGYTAAVAPTTVSGSPQSGKAGLAKWIDVTLADVVDPNITRAHPFYIRLGIDYATVQDGKVKIPANDFTIKRGYKSYVGGNVWQQDPQLLKAWTALDCNNLDAQNATNVPTGSQQGACPAASGANLVLVLASATSIGALAANGKPVLNKYYYDTKTGYLYLNIVQQTPNPIAPSPTGSCSSAYDGGTPDPSCPDTAAGETYYACPKNGCVDYTIAINDPSYAPGPSTGQPAAADLKPAPVNQNQLVLYGTDTVVTRDIHLDKQGVPYYSASTNTAPACRVTEPDGK